MAIQGILTDVEFTQSRDMHRGGAPGWARRDLGGENVWLCLGHLEGCSQWIDTGGDSRANGSVRVRRRCGRLRVARDIEAIVPTHWRSVVCFVEAVVVCVVLGSYKRAGRDYRADSPGARSLSCECCEGTSSASWSI